MNRIDIMVDIETLGLTPKHPMIQLGAVAFDVTTGEIASQFVRGCRLESDSIVDGRTLEWWFRTNATLLEELVTNGKDTEREALLDFNAWIDELCYQNGLTLASVYLWGNGIIFDNHIIKDKMIDNGIDYPISYTNDRDVRTIVELYCAKTGEDYRKDLKPRFRGDLIEHDGLVDAKVQAMMVSHCYKELMK